MPLGFFRTQSLVILGLLVLAGLDLARAEATSWALWTVIFAAVMAYLSAVTWGLGLPRFGVAASVLARARRRSVVGRRLRYGRPFFIPLCRGEPPFIGLLAGLDADGHAAGPPLPDRSPAMSIEPLKRMVVLIGLCLGGSSACWPCWT